MLRAALFTFLFATPLLAQDGGQLYTLYCSACHGADGKGATGGAFPPLAGSPWVLGDAALPVKVVLHGLHGPVEVDGRTFNLEMPPQGGVLPDDQLAAILTHVRSSWGNQAGKVTPEFVKATRDANADRKTPWTADELLKLHPLPASAPPIANLISQVYEGEWQRLPDFSQLKATNIEEEHDGKISLKKAGLTELFGMVWEGDLTAPESGEFLFRADADDGLRVLIDGKKVVEIDGTGPMGGGRAKEGKIELAAGTHKIRVEYFEYKGQEGIALAWRGPGIPRWKSLSDQAPGGREPIPVVPANGRAVVYRNFIEGTTPRAIGIGFPGGVNLAYSADHFAPELIWTGDFMDGSRHWIDRGQGNQPPAGENVVKLSGSPALPKDARFRGYKLDPAGNPTFAVQIGNQYLLDSWSFAPSYGSRGLLRTVTVRGQGQPVELLLSDQLEPRKTGNQDYELGNAIHLQVGSFQPETSNRLHPDPPRRVEPAVPEIRDGKLYLKLSPGQTATLTYRWK